MNAAGLSCDAQTLIGTVYPREGHQDVVSLCRWALERFGSLKELELELKNATPLSFQMLCLKQFSRQFQGPEA